MSENGARRRPRVLSGGEVGDLLGGDLAGGYPSEAARRHSVDVHGHRYPPHGEGRRVGCLAARPGRRAKERNWELEQAQREVGQLTEAVKSQAIELALLRGKVGWA